MTKTASFGSISSGTMRPQDLIPDFAGELERLGGGKTHQQLIHEADSLTDYDSEDADEIMAELVDALSEYAPPYGYFGSHPGDGADYGFWPIEDMADCFDGLKVSDTSEVPADYSGEVLHVNDHGNCTLYAADKGELREVWALV